MFYILLDVCMMAFPIMANNENRKKTILISIYNELTSEKVRHCLELGDIVLLVAAVLLYIHNYANQRGKLYFFPNKRSGSRDF